MTSHTVTFDKFFTDGILDGITMRGEKVSFASLRSAEAFANRLRDANIKDQIIWSVGNGSNYKAYNISI